jgi:uncharacterized protein (UPF0262 family)
MRQANAQPPKPDGRLARIVLEGESLTRLSPMLEAERAQSVADLEADNLFSVLGTKRRASGPYDLHLAIREGRLTFDIRRADGRELAVFVLALGPFRMLIKDYQLLVDSHSKAIGEGREARIQAIDMGRRALHNEGAALMIERLTGKIAMNFDTARRLFTLVCVLHQRI